MLAMTAPVLLRDRKRFPDLLAGYLAVSVLAFLLLNLCYGYQETFEPLSSLDLRSHFMQALQRHVGDLPMPLPRQLILGVDSLKWESEIGLPAYLLGESYIGGRWDYFPIALACKLPIGAWCLLITAGVSFFMRRPRLDEMILLIALLIIGLASMFGTNLDLGVRYLLPAYPLAIVLVARLWSVGKKTSIVATGALVLLIIESLLICPRYLTFFNALAGGPSRGWKIVNDSNFDWGQGLIDLKRWLDANHAGKIELAYRGVVDPAVYGVDYTPFGKGSDEPFVVIGACLLDGQIQRSASTHGEIQWVQIPYYRQLQQTKPVAVPGGTMFIFTRQQIDAAKDLSQGR
jgi:hypothetical protein